MSIRQAQDKQKIVPHLWFDKQAKEAAEFYVSIFGKNSKVTSSSVLHNTPSGDTDIVGFELWGYEFLSISAGPYFKFTPAISISVQCNSEAEIDEYYKKLSEGGQVLMELNTYPWSAKYGWINDKYGLSWQLNLPNDQAEIKQRICPHLMFINKNTGKAKEAMEFYTSIFPNSGIDSIFPYQGQPPDKDGTVAHGEFHLFGEQFMALDSAAEHKFNLNEAVSLIVKCEDQEEIDYYWEKLSAVPEAEQCGWLKDKFGVSWQIVPTAMDEMMNKGNSQQIERVTKAFLPMKKFIIADIHKAYQEK